MAGQRCAYLGNFTVPYSTESHIAISLESLGVEVTRIQEGETPALDIPTHAKGHDFFLWTQTYGLAETGGTRSERGRMLYELKLQMPTVSYHLDRWWGLDREVQVPIEPFFRADYLFTADGGHDDKWAELGINHIWLPPGVVHTEAVDGTPRPEYKSDIAFVGSWRSYGHKEWEPKRLRMLNTLRKKYGRRFKCWPVKQAIRGMELTDLYASVKVAVGDSCLVGDPSSYWSDRIPESTGRGALLVHPYVQGLEEIHPDLPVFQRGNLDHMVDVIDSYLNNPEPRELLRKRVAEHTRNNHTYRHRLQTVLSTIFPS